MRVIPLNIYFSGITYPFSSCILVPQVCDVGRWHKKKIGYEGYMKLSDLHPDRFKPEVEIKNKYIETNKYCLIRIAKLTAHHDYGIKGLNNDLVLRLINLIEEKGYKVFISSESSLMGIPGKYLLKINYSDIHHILSYATLLISDSQSMPVEASVLGVPSLRFSDFKGKISVLEELENKYQLTYAYSSKEEQRLIQHVESILTDPDILNKFSQKRSKMLSEKIDVAAFVAWFIGNYPDSKDIMKTTPSIQFNISGKKMKLND